MTEAGPLDEIEDDDDEERDISLPGVTKGKLA